MPIFETEFEGVKVFEPKVWEDNRGYFFESYNRKTLAEEGISEEFVQDNQAKSQYGVIRGLHYQVEPFAQAKLVRVIKGKVQDVILDLRPGSKTYGKWLSIILSESNKKQLFIPRGFAHGYLVLSEEAEFFYKCDNYYSFDHEGGINFQDPNLNIKWELDSNQLVISTKDMKWPNFGQHRPIKAHQHL